MAQLARVHALPDSGRGGRDERAWLHDLTPTLSDASMFDVEGCVQPLSALPPLRFARRAEAPLRLVVRDAGYRTARTGLK